MTGDLTDRTVSGISYWINNTLIPALKNEDKTTWSAGLGEAIMQGFAGVDEWIEANKDQISYDVGYSIGKIIILGIQGAAGILATLASDPIGLVLKNWIAQGGLQGGDAKDVYGLGIAEFAANVAKGIEDAWKDSAFINRIEAQGKALVASIVAGIKLGWTTSIDGLKKDFANIANIMIQAVKDVFGIASPSTVMMGIGAEIVNGLKQGIRDAATDFAEWIVDWARGIIPQPLWKFFGIGSPSRLMIEMGRNIGGGLALGILQSADSVNAAMGTIMGQISGASAPSLSFAPSMVSGASGGSFGRNGTERSAMDMPPITVNVYAAGGGADVVQQAAVRGVEEVLYARGYR